MARHTFVRLLPMALWLLSAAGCRTPSTREVEDEPKPASLPADTAATRVIKSLGESVGDYLKEPPMKMGYLGDAMMMSPSAPDALPGEERFRWELGSFRAVPVPLASPMLGIGGGVAAGYIFHPDYEDRHSHPSVIGVGAFGTDRGTWGVAAGLQAYLSQDRYRVVAGVGGGRLRYDFYGIGSEAGRQEEFLPLEQTGYSGVVEFLRRIRTGIYFGPRYRYWDTKTTTQAINPLFPEAPPPGEQIDAVSSGLGLRFIWDTRDSSAYPTKGHLLDVIADFNEGAWGSDFDYQVYSAAANKYLQVSERAVLALRGYGRFASGDVPFYDLSLYGKRADLRGYTTGRWRDRMLLAFQAEYRHRINETWGVNVFAGIGGISDKLDDWSSGDSLPAGGIGVRYTLPIEARATLALDLAYGDEGIALYLGIGEFF